MLVGPSSIIRQPDMEPSSMNNTEEEGDWRHSPPSRELPVQESSGRGSQGGPPRSAYHHQPSASSITTISDDSVTRSDSRGWNRNSTSNSALGNSSPSSLSGGGLGLPRVSLAHRNQTPSSGNGFHLDGPNHSDDPPPFTASPSSSSITDKLRHLKLKSRAGVAFGGLGLANGDGGGGGGMARNTRAASAFVRRQPTGDELDQHVSAYGDSHHSHRPERQELPRPSSNIGTSSHQQQQYHQYGSQTPVSGAIGRHQVYGLTNNSKNDRHTPVDSHESISTNSSYESIHGGSLNILQSRQRALGRRTPGVQDSYATTSSPSSNNSSSSFNSNMYPSPALNTNSLSHDRISPQPSTDREYLQQPQPQRRQRFTSEPAPPPMHLQIHSPNHSNASMNTANMTPFGKARHQHHASLSQTQAVNQGNITPATNGPSLLPPTSSYAQHYASLMDEVDQQQDRDTYPTQPNSSSLTPPQPYSSAFEAVSNSSHAGVGRVASPSYSTSQHRVSGTRSPYSGSYDDRPIGGGGTVLSRETSQSSEQRDYNGDYSYQDDFLPSPELASPTSTNGNGRHTPSTAAASGTSSTSSKWDLTTAEASAMGMNFSLPPSMSPSSANSAPPSKRAKPLMRAKPSASLSIPYGSPNQGGAVSFNLQQVDTSSPPLITSPARSRNPRMSSLSTPGSAKDSSSSLSNSDDGNYVASCDLLPIPSVNQAEVNNIMKALQSSDWSVRFDSLTSLRRLLVHHSQLLAPHTKNLVRDLKAEVNSLRSSLAKNAIMALSDAFVNLSKSMEMELEHIGPPLLKRAGEPSGFLREEAHKALLAMIAHCSDKQTLPFLLNASTTGTKIIKTMSCVYLDRAIECYGSRGTGASLQANKEWSRLLKVIGIFSSDAAVESRTHSRWSLIRLARVIGLDELDRTMKKMLPAAHYHAVNKVLGKGMDQLNTELTAASLNLSPLLSSPTASSGASSLQSSLQSSPISKRTSQQHTSFSLPPGSDPFDALSASSRETSTPSEGADSIGARKPRRVKPPATAAPTRNSDAGGNGSISSSGGSGDGWGSLKGSGESKSGNNNLFDLDNPEYNNSPGSGSATSASPGPTRLAATAGPKRRPQSMASVVSTASAAADTERLTPILTELASNDWRTRMSSLENLKTWLTSSSSMSINQNIVKVYDQLCQRINDHHGKVNVAALQSLPQIIPLTKNYLIPVLGTFIPSLATNLASTNPQIRTLCTSGLDLLLTTIETPLTSFSKELQIALIQPFAQVALFENVKIRPLMIEKFITVLGSCADAAEASGQPPNLSTFKSAVPVAYSLCEESRVEIKTPLTKFAQILYSILGTSLWDEKVCMQFHISNQQVNKLKALLGV